jgi:hypothetical protein
MLNVAPSVPGGGSMGDGMIGTVFRSQDVPEADGLRLHALSERERSRTGPMP